MPPSKERPPTHRASTTSGSRSSRTNIDRQSKDRILGAAFERHQAGHFADAALLYRQVLDEAPDDPDANYLLGMLFDQSGDKKAAVSLVARSISVDSTVAEVHRNLGAIFAECSLYDQAVASLQKATSLDPTDAEAHSILGDVFKHLNDRLKALDCFKRALALDPDHAKARNNLGIIFAEQGNFIDAQYHYNYAINRNHVFPEPYNNLGSLLADGGEQDEAIALFRQALTIQPDYLSALNNLAISLREKSDAAGAIDAAQKAFSLDPESRAATFALFCALQSACDWNGFDEVGARLDQQTRGALQSGEKPEELPFINIGRAADPNLNHALAHRWSTYFSHVFDPVPYPKPSVSQRRADVRLTVGYLSSDFCDHAIGHLTRGLFGLHDRDRFRVHIYSAGKDDGSVYRNEARRDCELFTDVHRMSYVDTARRIHEDKVDILVDVNGYTRGGKMLACAWRPSPVQATWLGFPGTSGADFIDYVITDRIVTPDEHAESYSETFAYLPHCYQINGLTTDDAAENRRRSYSRGDFDLPDNGFVYCSFVNSFKIEPALFDTWMHILKATGDSVLWLFKPNDVVEANLRREASARGIDPDRLRFSAKLPRDDHLARLRCADLALDSWTYGGHTTTSDALRSGVPVLVRTGDHFASRVSTSIMLAAGMESLVTRTTEDYAALAIRLAHEPETLRALHARLAANLGSCPLFDTRQFVRSLEDCYRQMWDLYCSGEGPKMIYAR